MIDLLQKFHSKGLIHCDIKPDNILIGDKKINSKSINQLYLIDYGISQKYLDEDGNHLPLK